MTYTLYKFSASWCGPCKTLKKNLENVDFSALDVELVEVDADEDSEDLCAKYSIRSVPMLVLTKNGDELARIHGGGKTKDDIISWIESSKK